MPSPQASAGRQHLTVPQERGVGRGGSQHRHSVGSVHPPGAARGGFGQAGWKGELVVLGDGLSRSIFFERSNVIAAQSTVEGERLGEVLYRYGALTHEQLTTTSKAVQVPLRSTITTFVDPIDLPSR